MLVVAGMLFFNAQQFVMIPIVGVGIALMEISRSTSKSFQPDGRPTKKIPQNKPFRRRTYWFRQDHYIVTAEDMRTEEPFIFYMDTLPPNQFINLNGKIVYSHGTHIPGKVLESN